MYLKAAASVVNGAARARGLILREVPERYPLIPLARGG
jgi:hypothetical protein